jgi:hypothetical protein
MQPDGNIVLAGWAGSSFALARYLGSGGTPPPVPKPPVVEPITTPGPVLVGTTVMVSATFTYNIPTDQHTAVWNWGDGMTSMGNVTEANGMGSVTGSHVYAAPGIYPVTVTVTDQRGASGSATGIPGVVVTDPLAGSITGSGTINIPPFGLVAALASTHSNKLTFQVNARYVGNQPVPRGNAMFNFTATHRTFRSTHLDWLVFSGRTASYEGSGTINGAGAYDFFVSASSVGRGKIRIRIWDQTTGSSVYDSQPGSPFYAAPATPISAGRITLHRPHRHKHRPAVARFGQTLRT